MPWRDLNYQVRDFGEWLIKETIAIAVRVYFTIT
jgi:hypothetical protein